MKARYVQRGESIDYIPEKPVSAGDIVKLGSLVGVAKLDIAVGELGALALVGVYEIETGGAAIAAGEGEKYSAVCGLFSAFIIESLGGATGPHLLPLLYAAAGCVIGILAKDYLTNSLAVKLLYVFFCCLGRAVVSVLTAKAVLSASFGSIMTDIVIPEFFSTAVLSPLPFFAVWICYRRFHKSREERTGL